MNIAEIFNSLDAQIRTQTEIASILEYLVAPFYSQFTDKVALFCAGIEWSIVKVYYTARSNLAQRYMIHQKHYLRQCCGSPLYACDEESVKSRYKYFVRFAQRWPNVDRLEDFEKDLYNFDPLKVVSGIERAAAIRLVGGDPKIRRIDQAMYRFDNKVFIPKGMRGRLYLNDGELLDPKVNLPVLKDPAPHTQPQRYSNHAMQNTTVSHLVEVIDSVPPCAAPTLSVNINVESDDQTSVSMMSSPPSLHTSSSPFNRLSLSSSSSNSTSLSEQEEPSICPSDAPSNKSRRTAKQANEYETAERQVQLLREVAFKGATVFVKSYKDGLLKSCFSSVDQIVTRVNTLFGKANNPLISSREIVNAVKEGRINVAPPKKGHGYRLGEEVMHLLADLFFSHNAISQHDADGQLSRQQLISVLQSIVSPKADMDWRHLNKEIEIMNNFRQTVNTTTSRQALRVHWFNTRTLIKHYENFESEMVRLKCARWSTKEELENCNEKIKWFDDQRTRVINGDEMSFGLDTDSNNLGGRPGMQYSANAVRDAGSADQHSSTKMTIFCAMTYNDEVLPPLIILTAT